MITLCRQKNYIEQVLEQANRVFCSFPHCTGYNYLKTHLKTIVSIFESNVSHTDPPTSPFYILLNQCLLALNNLSSLSCEAAISPSSSVKVLGMSGSPGRPKLYIKIDFLELLREVGYTWVQISQVFGTSRTTLWRCFKESGIQFQSIQIFQTPHWITLQRKRISDSLARVDPLNHKMRCQPIVRRVYRVPGANSLWHIDGNHKLIKWQFIIHGGTDGFSRLIDYLHCSTNNRSATVMTLFHEAAETYRVPSRVRSDMGGENILVCHYGFGQRYWKG